MSVRVDVESVNPVKSDADAANITFLAKKTIGLFGQLKS